MFELGRRYKIMNPERMRTAYGKLMYFLQDASDVEIKEILGFNCVRGINTVYSFLLEKNGLDVLKDPLVATATREIITDGKSRRQIQLEIKQKERAVEDLARKYSREPEKSYFFRNSYTADDSKSIPSNVLSSDDIRLCLYSIADNHSYLRGNR